MVNAHMNGNWSEDNQERRERSKVGGKDQSTSDALFSYPPKSHALFLKHTPKDKKPFSDS